MKLFAQHGAQEGEKITEALTNELLDGVIYSPKDISPDKLIEKLEQLDKNYPTIERLFDPQFYVTLMVESDSRLGYLEDKYDSYFHTRRRNDLERESEIIKDIDAVLKFQKELKVTALIAPNILIPRSLDSIEAAISKNFIRTCVSRYRKLNEKRPIYASLIIGKDALGDKKELREFLNDITLVEDRPEGFYVFVAFKKSDIRADIYNADVIAAWMLINHSLALNGFRVINGYSDLISSFLSAAGGYAGASGWWNNLRNFAEDRFGPASGGRLPVQRYLSTRLMNRITYFELNELRNKVPSVLNGLPLDSLYAESEGSEPQRNKEVLQAWEGLKALNGKIDAGKTKSNLIKCQELISSAEDFYLEVEENISTRLDVKSVNDHLEGLAEGIKSFAKLAEIDLPNK